MAGPTTLFQTGVHASRPAAAAGCVLYACTTDSKVYRSDGTSWTDWMTIPTGASMATDTLWDAAGDLAQGTGANTAARLALGAAGTVVRSTGSTNAYAFPPGHEFDYVEKTSNTNITATTASGADTIVTGAAVTYDGSTAVMVEWYANYVQQPGADSNVIVLLYDGSTNVASIAFHTSPTATGYANNFRVPSNGRLRVTPSNASHTYSIRAYVSGGTGVVAGGSGSGGNSSPCFMRITKV